MGNSIIRKIIKRGMVISLAIAIVIFLALILIIKYRIKSVIKEVVRRETRGVYELDFSKISIDYVEGRIKLKAVDLKRINTNSDKKDHRLTIDHLYLSLGSWGQLFFHRKLFVDSLQLIAPDITMMQQAAQQHHNGLAPLQEIFRSLRDISEIFKVHVLEVNRGKISIYRENNASPVVINNINLRIDNFGEKKIENNHLRYADNVTLNIGKQNWSFTSGQTIELGNLFFSGREQAFQVDSCSITMAPDKRGQRTSLFAEKFLFRTNEIASLFEKNELNIDTLYCKSPVLSVALPANAKTSDTVSDLNESIHQLPANVNIKFVNIENGQIHLVSADGKRSYTGKRTNIKVYRLHIGHDPVPVIRTGSVDLDLHELSFASRDSLFLLTVNEFRLDSNNLVCKNAYLKPSHAFKGYLSGINLPAFTLYDISVKDLLEKRLKGQLAVIEKPQFFFTAGVAGKKGVEKGAEKGIPLNRFYNTLKDLAQLIDVRWLTMKDGTLDYLSGLPSAPGLSMRNIDAEINLADLLHSASPEATKQSIHQLSIGALHLKKNNTSIDLENFFIDGSREIGQLRSLRVQLAGGIRLNAANLYWERFSWEDFVRNKSIHLDTLNIPSLAFFARPTFDQPAENKGGLLPLTINKLNIGESVLDVKTNNNAEIKAKTNHIALTGLHTAGRYFSWQSGSVGADSIFFKDDNKQIAVKRLNFSSYSESAMQDLEYSDSTNLIRVPEIKFQLQLNNSRFEELEFPFLSLYRPEVLIKSSPDGYSMVVKNKASILMPFHIGKLAVVDGYFRFQRTGNPLNISARFDVHTQMGGMEKSNQGVLVFDKVFLKVDSLSLVKPLQHGLLAIRELSATVGDYPLSINLGSNNSQLKNMVNNIRITGGRVLYNDSSTVASVSKITGNGKEGTLALKDVDVKPVMPLRTFLKTAVWQKDYLTFQCDSIGLVHINNQALLNDTALIVRYIYLQSPRLSTFRNKNMAFQHGIEKLMPTKLIAGIKIPVQIDSVQIKGATVHVHEVSAITKRESVVPLALDAVFKKIVSRPRQQDSLVLEVSGKVLDYDVRTLRYAESYRDSLSGFTMHYGISPMQLSHLTKVTNPLSALAITNGRADTLFAKVSGNKYAAFGSLDFYYHNLKVRLLNKEDSLKRGLLLSLETLLANGLIKSNNQSPARMFFVRDREKFVFNYWVKTLFSGLVTSVGVKRSSKYKKLYNEAEEKYSLPAASTK